VIWANQRDADDGTLLFRSEKRVPQPSLVLFDDRGTPGETMVIRKREFRIGRAQGDLLIPHDLLVSGKHACLRWREDQLDLIDEGSRNGTYWRLRQGCSYELRDGDRFLCGRFVFQWAENSGIVRLASFTDLGGAVRDFPIQRTATLTIGRDPGCTIRISKDNFLSPQHARILFDRKHGTYVLTDEGGLNGVFIKLTGPMPLADGDMFRLGEQLIGVLFPSPNLS
jgi:pSer/pThr/pTyr-binding forkhead associated (FHA) protein